MNDPDPSLHLYIVHFWRDYHGQRYNVYRQIYATNANDAITMERLRLVDEHNSAAKWQAMAK